MNFESIEHFLIANESAIRLSVFLSLLLLFGILEFFFRARPVRISKYQRWLSHLLLSIVSTAALRLLIPFAGITLAQWCSNNNIGLLNFLGWSNSTTPKALNAFLIIFSVFVLDFIIYCQHRAFHKVSILWRLHKVHHADAELDASTAIRFHPFEIILSFILKIMAIITFGIPPLAVFLFELLLNGMAIFNHSNIKLPPTIEGYLRYLIVTPNMHSIHHSQDRAEHDSNFSFNLSIWDRVFSTYTGEHKGELKIGLENFGSEGKADSLWKLLTIPFRNN